jgi:hypothetical protein
MGTDIERSYLQKPTMETDFFYRRAREKTFRQKDDGQKNGTDG